MNKGIKITLGVVAGLGIFSMGLFGKDIVTKAGTDWQTNAINNSYAQLVGTANDTKDDLVQNIDSDVNEKVSTAIQGSVEDQQKELEKLLEQYYQMKLDGLTDSEQYKQLEQRIKEIQQSVLDAFKKQIDDEFAKQSGQ